MVHKDLLTLVHHHPYADVKLTTLEQHWALNVLLDDPAGVFRPGGYKPDNIIELIEYLNTTTLVCSRRLDQPDVVGAMLHGNAFFRRETLRKLLISLEKLLGLRVIHGLRHQVGGGCGVENLIVGAPSLLILEVVVLKGLYQTRLGH